MFLPKCYSATEEAEELGFPLPSFLGKLGGDVRAGIWYLRAGRGEEHGTTEPQNPSLLAVPA